MHAETAIRAAIAEFAAAYEAGDVDGVLACYGDDLVKVRHAAAPESKAETAARLREVFAQFVGRVDATVDELIVLGTHAIARGSFIVTLTPRGGGGPRTLARRYVEVWRNEGGRWLVVRTMDNVGPDVGAAS